MTRKTGAQALPSRDEQLDTGRMEHVPFGQLAVSPLNVRKNAEVGPDDELVASIKAHGLLQPLVGYIARSGEAIVLVCAGQRRLLALQHIAAPDTPIPVRIVDEETAIEVSLAENLERKDMNPADEVAAFQALIETGHYDAARISSRFGYTLQHIRRRLKMAQLLPEILDTLREGKISLDAATAYASASEEVQRDIFKKHSAKGAWKPHEPAAIRQDISLHGISASSRVAKFIGGFEAYKAAGGTAIDEDFSELFSDGQHDGRMRDVSIVRRLIDQRQAELTPAAEKLARKKHPFVTGVEWMDLLGTTYGSTIPKQKKDSGLVAVESNWSVKPDVLAERVKQAVDEHGATAIALADVNNDGQLEIVTGKFLVGKDAWTKVQPAKEEEETRQAETPAERAAREREREINAIMVNLYARSLIGETPGFGTTQVSVGHDDRLRITLIRLGDPGGDDLVGDRWNRGVRPELLEPYRDTASMMLEEIEADRERANKAAVAQRENFDAKLVELEELPIAEWPPVTVVTTNIDENETLIITRIEQDGEHVFNLVDSMESPSTSNDAGFTVEVIRDQTEELKASIKTYDSIEAFAADHAGRCRMCGCTEAEACLGSEEGEWSGPCGWADATQTLCSNPDCLAKAGITAAEEKPEKAEAAA